MERITNVRISTLTKVVPLETDITVTSVAMSGAKMVVVDADDNTYELGTITVSNACVVQTVENHPSCGSDTSRANVIANLLRGVDGKDGKDGKTQDLSEYYKKSEVDGKLKQKQDTISDLDTIRTNAEKGAAAVQPSQLAKVATSGNYNDLSDKPHIPAEVTEQKVRDWGFTKNTGTYSKPASGIPKTDLASDVQTSLGRANSALQSVPSEYITETELEAKKYATKTEVSNALIDKVDKVEGKGLSTEDFTTGLKDKLETATDIVASQIFLELHTVTDDFQVFSHKSGYEEHNKEVCQRLIENCFTDKKSNNEVFFVTINGLRDGVPYMETAILESPAGEVVRASFVKGNIATESSVAASIGILIIDTETLRSYVESGEDAFYWSYFSTRVPSIDAIGSGGENDVYVTEFTFEEIITNGTTVNVSPGLVNAVYNKKIIVIPTRRGPNYIATNTYSAPPDSTVNLRMQIATGVYIYDVYLGAKTPAPQTVQASVSVTRLLYGTLSTINGASIAKGTDMQLVSSISLNGKTYTPTKGAVDLGNIEGGSGNVDLSNYYTKEEVDSTLKTHLPYSVIPNKWCRHTDGVFVDTGSYLRCLKVEAKDIQWIGVRVYLSDSHPCAIAFFRQDGTYIIDASVQGRATSTSGEIFTAKVPSDAYYAYATTRVLEGFEPEVYTYNASPFLIDEVTALNNAMSCNGYSLRSELFISGVIDVNSGKVTEYKGNSIVSSLIDVVKGFHYELRNATKYNIALFWYNDDGTYNSSSWYSRITEFTATTNNLRIGMRLADNAPFTVEYYDDYPLLIMTDVVNYRRNTIAEITSVDTSVLLDQQTYPREYNNKTWLLPTLYAGRVCIPMQFTTGGIIRVSCNFDKCRCAVVQYDTQKLVSDSAWLSSAKEVAITGYAWYVQLMGVDYSPITIDDVVLSIEVVIPLHPSYAIAEQTYNNKRAILDEKLATINNVTIGANFIPRLNAQDYAHLFIDKIYTTSRVTIPHQSVFCVAAASRLGFEMMEFNTTFTSDGIPVVGHPVTTNTLQILTDLDGNPVEVNVANTTYNDLRNNYRYNSIYPQYRTPINSLEEVLLACREYKITPFIGNGGDARIKAIAHRIVGDGYVEYSGSNDTDMPLYSFYSDDSLDTIWTRIVGKNAVGIAGIADTLLESLSDEAIVEFKSRLYTIGWRMAWAGCYCSAEIDYRMRRLGLYANASRVDVPKFTDCDIHFYANAVKGFSDFSGDFSVDNNVAILNDGGTIKRDVNNESIISKAQLSIIYSGTLQIVFGKKVITLTSDGTNEVCLSSVIESIDVASLKITSTGITSVYSIDYRYASVV